MKNRAAGYYDPQGETLATTLKNDFQRRKLGELLPMAYRESAAIRENFDRLGLKPEEIQSIQDLERIPITKKSELIGNAQSLRLHLAHPGRP